jgi:fructuronate reductase
VTPLSETSRSDFEDLAPLQYDRDRVTPGIIHIGVGNFHRGHQAVFVDDLLASDPRWGIVGVSMRSTETRDRLAKQNYLYTVTERDGSQLERRLIGSIQSILILDESRAEIMALAARESIRLITLTVTENGYCHTASGELDNGHPDVVHDLAHPETPRSAPGLVAALLGERMQSDSGPITVLSCDNVSENGAVTQSVVTGFARLLNPPLATWIEENVNFPNTMVDRIVPSTTQADIADIAAEGIPDRGLINTEPFKQWVIENSLFANTPDWSSIGVTLVDEVLPHETMKLRFLNATHSAISYLGLLCSHEFVHEAMADDLLYRFVESMMDDEITSVAIIPPESNLEDYKRSILRRFANSAVPYKTAQVATNGSLKLPQRIFPTISQHLDNGQVPLQLTTIVAAWLVCLTDTSISAKFDDPVLPITIEPGCHGRDDLLGELAFERRFTSAVDARFQQLQQLGCRATLQVSAGGD